MKAALVILASAGVSHALIGVSIDMYKPSCAHGCRRAMRNVRLDCTEMSPPTGDGQEVLTTAPECFALSTPFLTTLAWCIQDACRQETQAPEAWELEKYWAERLTYNVNVPPKWSYTRTLQQIELPPNSTFNATGLLDSTSLVPKQLWLLNKVSLEAFERQERLHTYHGLIVLLTGTLAPVLFSLLLFFPVIPTVLAQLQPYLIYPSMFSKPMPRNLGTAPTVGQGLYIAMFVGLNVVCTGIDYHSVQPNAMYKNTREEILLYVANRTGVIAFALLPLVILLAGRNNFLLWITNWSHSTYMLLHRHFARIFTVHCVVHSIVEVELYRSQGTIVEELKLPYWSWGVVATVATCAMLVFSTMWWRRLSYEIFLISHIILAVFLLVGSWYHIDLLFSKRWGYEYWLYAAFAVWIFDRVLRTVRIFQNGLLKAEVKELGDSRILRIDIPGVRWGSSPGQHAYVTWPGLSWWQPWENHPFSVLPLGRCRGSDHDSEITITSPSTSDVFSPATTIVADIEKAFSKTASINIQSRPALKTGVRIYVKKHKGVTSRLSTRRNVATLLEGPYHNHNPSTTANSGVLACDKLLLLAGGIGITGVVSWIHSHHNVKLYWSVRDQSRALVEDIQESGVLDTLNRNHRAEVIITCADGRRKNLTETLDHEVIDALHDSTAKNVRIGVVSCGPPEFCEGVRSAVVTTGRRESSRVQLDFIQEAFGW